MNKLKLGLPAGSLQNTTLEMFRKAGYNIHIGERSYYPYIDDEEIECVLMRAQEIPKYVEDNVLDVGLTGKDWITETAVDVIEMADLNYSKRGLRPVRLVLAVPQDSSFEKAEDLAGKRIATELVETTKRYFEEKGIKATISFSWGATEVKPPLLADAIAELTETGRSLKANQLKVIETILVSTPRVIMNNQSFRDAWKKKKVDNMITLLKGALLAEQKVMLKMNVHSDNLAKIVDLLPALRKPTISNLCADNWVAVETVVDEQKVRTLICELQEAGAEGILEFPMNKIIP
ncbi:MAG: ATP phosphoribosyltransferase [Dethiobacteria bacterium]|nr:ATP phosphoribosyltransferase [Bacillota bacterium]MDW7728613.1 ATP phosphoribosyltransferase [Bacillota bacterium]